MVYEQLMANERHIEKALSPYKGVCESIVEGTVRVENGFNRLNMGQVVTARSALLSITQISVSVLGLTGPRWQRKRISALKGGQMVTFIGMPVDPIHYSGLWAIMYEIDKSILLQLVKGPDHGHRIQPFLSGGKNPRLSTPLYWKRGNP